MGCIWFAPNIQDIEVNFSVFRRAFRFVTWLLAKTRHAVMFIFFRSGFLLTKESAKSAVLKILMSDKMLCNTFSTVSGLLVTRMTSSLFLCIAHASFIHSVELPSTMNLMCVGIHSFANNITFCSFFNPLIDLRVSHHSQIFCFSGFSELNS